MERVKCVLVISIVLMVIMATASSGVEGKKSRSGSRYYTHTTPFSLEFNEREFGDLKLHNDFRTWKIYELVVFSWVGPKDTSSVEIAVHDCDGKARSISYPSSEGVLNIGEEKFPLFGMTPLCPISVTITSEQTGETGIVRGIPLLHPNGKLISKVPETQERNIQTFSTIVV